jgi:hypothetical protein
VRLARRESACRTGAASYDAGTQTRYEGALAIRVRRPCDASALANSSELPASPFAPGEELFGEAERDQLLAALDFGLQPGWSPQPPVLRTGLAFARFNRVEGVSWGGSATSALGGGYTATATARLGLGDLIPNAELALARTNGRSTVRAGAFHRLAVANDDWGNPLSLGASLAAALYGRDEGFYYRTWGAELGGTRPAPFGAASGWNPLRGATLAGGCSPSGSAARRSKYGAACSAPPTPRTCAPTAPWRSAARATSRAPSASTRRARASRRACAARRPGRGTTTRPRRRSPPAPRPTRGAARRPTRAAWPRPRCRARSAGSRRA